ncbi:MAG: chromosomal replication initiator protein DnaA [Anaerolineaceae bacterium]|nr:chromosomal replication initiator protein DnaA [Anaerolineaceae bacterium]MDE0328964.1 chromosomal replication initiator protein DnaA [Anaerolineaceae bacterium]
MFETHTVDPQEAWKTTLNQLEIQLDRGNFDTWLRDTVFLGCENAADGQGVSTFTIGVRNSFARDNLQHRLYRSVRRVLRDVYGTEVELRFEVWRADESRNGSGNRGENIGPIFDPPTMKQPDRTNRKVGKPPQGELPESHLNPRYTFDRFVTSNANMMLYSAARAVAEEPAARYNPFVIYGGVGLGKTHLLQAIANESQQSNFRALYIPSEGFINDLVNAIRYRTTAQFREKYRSVDLLLIDDIQFIAGKESTQEEFFHTFNALHIDNKQIVVASDRHPSELELLEDRLRSRFEGGLVIDIQLPEFETRVAIVESWAQERGRSLPRSISEKLADGARNSIRELEGLFTSMLATMDLADEPFSTTAAGRVVQQHESARARQVKITIDQVLSATAATHNLTVMDLTGKNRSGHISRARHVAMYLARDLTEASFPQIGRAFGMRSHSTAMHGHERVAGQMQEDEAFRYELLALRERIIKGE